MALRLNIEVIESDLWSYRGKLIARHENKVWKLPILYDKWKLGVSSRRPLYLPELCEKTHGAARLLLDLKGRSNRLVPDVIRTLREQNAMDTAAICGQNWAMLDAARGMAPSLKVYYSFGGNEHLNALRSRTSKEPRILAASVWERLLTEELLAEFRRREIAVLAWTVNIPERAAELLGAGVDGIISDRLDLLQSMGAGGSGHGAKTAPGSG